MKKMMSTKPKPFKKTVSSRLGQLDVTVTPQYKKDGSTVQASALDTLYAHYQKKSGGGSTTTTTTTSTDGGTCPPGGCN